MATKQELARQELARRELARRQQTIQPTSLGDVPQAVPASPSPVEPRSRIDELTDQALAASSMFQRGIKRGVGGIAATSQATLGSLAKGDVADFFANKRELEQANPEFFQTTPQEAARASQAPTTAAVAQFAGEVIPQAALGPLLGPALKVGPVTTGLVGGTTGAVTAPESTPLDVGVGAGIGAGIPVVGKLASKTWEITQKAIPAFSRRAARKEAVGSLSQTDVDEAIEVFEENGLWLSPGEASGSPSRLAQEGRLDFLPQQQKDVLERKLLDRRTAIEADLEDIVKNLDVSPEELSRQVELRNLMPDIGASTAQMNRIMRHPLFTDVLEGIQRDPALAAQFNEVPPNSLAGLNIIKRFIDKNVTAANRGASDVVKETNKSVYQNYSRLIRNIGDKAAKDAGEEGAWRALRSLDQRGIVADNFNELLFEGAGRVREGGKLGVDLNSVWNRAFKTDKNFNKLVQDLDTLIDPTKKAAAIKQLRNMRTILSGMAQGSLDKTVTGGGEAFAKRASPAAAGFFSTVNLLRGRYNSELVEVMTDPGQWSKHVAKVNTLPKADRLPALGVLLARVQAFDSDIPQQLSEEEEELAEKIGL